MLWMVLLEGMSKHGTNDSSKGRNYKLSIHLAFANVCILIIVHAKSFNIQM